jgi:hypothetical protein
MITPAQRRMLEIVRDQDTRRIYEGRQWRRLLTTLNRKGLVQGAVDLPTGRELTAKGVEALEI